LRGGGGLIIFGSFAGALCLGLALDIIGFLVAILKISRALASFATGIGIGTALILTAGCANTFNLF
jgi:hypothetical protein